MSTPDIGSYYQQERADEIDAFKDVGLYQALRTGSVITLEMVRRYLGQIPASPFVVAELSKFSSDTLVKNLQKVVDEYYAKSISDPAIKAGIHALLLQTLAKIHQERQNVLQQELVTATDREELLTKKTFVDTVAALQTVVDSVKKQPSVQASRYVDSASSACAGRAEDLLDDFASYTAADGKRVDDLMDHLYQTGFSKFAPTEQDKTGLRKLRKLAAKDLHVGRAELEEQYQRMLRRLRKILEPMRSDTDDSTIITHLRKYVGKNPAHYRAKRVLEQLTNIERRLVLKQPLLTDTEFEVYLSQLCSADPASGKIRRADLAKRTEMVKGGGTRTVDQRYSLLRFEQNRFACTLGGTRKAPFQEHSRQKDHLFDDALVIGKGMFGTVKFAFDPITGHAWADKKEVLGRTNTEIRDLDFKTKAVKLDETSREQFAREGEVLIRTDLQVGRVVMERYQAKTSYLAQHPEFTLRHTLQRLLPGQDMKDMIDGEDKQRPTSSQSASPARASVPATPPRTPPQTIRLSTPPSARAAAASATPTRSVEIIDPARKDFYQRQLEIRLGYAIQMARGLYELHVEYGIIHGDVKPKNFMSRWFDFGTAEIVSGLEASMTEQERLRVLATARTETTFDLAKDGTPEYMAPNLFLNGYATKGKVSLTPKDDIYSLGASIFGITHFATYQKITEARKRKLPEMYYDGDDQLISTRPQRRGQTPDYAAAKVGDGRIYLGENAFESHGLRLGVIADQVARHNPTDERFKTLAVDLEKIFISMCAIEPASRADDRGLRLHIMKLEELRAKVRALCSADQQRQQKLYTKFNTLKDLSLKDSFTSANLVTLKQRLIEKYDKTIIEISMTEGTPLLNLLLDALQEEDAPALQNILSKIPSDDLLQMYQEAENGQHSPLVAAIVQCKPQLFGALLQHLPDMAMAELFTAPFNSSYHENENLLHIAAQLNQTEILQQIFTKFSETAKTKIFSRPTNNGLLDQYSVFEWAIYHQNKVLIDLYCQQVGTSAELQTKIKQEKDVQSNTLLHIALYQKATRSFKSLIEQSGITYQDLLTEEVYKNDSALNPLFLAFDDNDIVVSELISLAQSNPGFAVIFNAFLFNKDNEMQLSPYHLAIRGNNPLIIKALNDYVSDKPEIASQLQSLSEIKDKEDNNPLHDAIANRNVELVKFFLDKISTEKLSKLISDQNVSGVSSLQFLLLSGDPLYRVQDQEIFAAISHKASGLPAFKEILHKPMDDGSLPLYAAIKNQHPIVVQIISATLDPNSSIERDQYLAQLGHQDSEGRNALHHMANIEDGVLNDVIQGLYKHVGPHETAERDKLGKRLKELLTENDHNGKSALDYFAENFSRDFTAILASLKLHGILNDEGSVQLTKRLKRAAATTDDSVTEASFVDETFSVDGDEDDSPGSTLNLAGPAAPSSVETSPEASHILGLRMQIQDLTAGLEIARSEIQRAKEEADDLRATVITQESRISTLDCQLESSELERTDLSRRLSELESSSKTRTAEKTREIETIRAALAEKDAEIVRLASEKTAQESELDALKRELEVLNAQVSATEVKASEAKAKEKKANQELKDLQLEHSNELKRLKEAFESDLFAARAEADDLVAKANKLELQLGEKTASIAQLENKLRDENKRAQEISETLEGLKKTSAEDQEAAVAKITELNRELLKQQALVQTLTEDKSSEEKSVASLTLEIAALEIELELYKAKAMTAEIKVDELNTELQAAKKEFDAERASLRAELDASVTQHRLEIEGFEDTVAKTTKELAEKIQTIEELEAQVARLEAQKESDHADLSNTISELTREKATLEREVAKLQLERAELKVQLNAAQVKYDQALADQSAEFAQERERLTGEVTAKQEELNTALSKHSARIEAFEKSMAILIQQRDAATSQVGIAKQGHLDVVAEVARLQSALASSEIKLQTLQSEHEAYIKTLDDLDAAKHSALLAQVEREQQRALAAEAQVTRLQVVVGDKSSELEAARSTVADATARLGALQQEHAEELKRLEKEHARKIKLSDHKISILDDEKRLLVEELLRARLQLEEAMGHIERILPEEIDRLIAEYKQNVEAGIRAKNERIGTLSQSMVRLQVEIPARFATFKLEKSRLEATVEKLERQLDANAKKIEEELAARDIAIAAQERLVTEALEANAALRKEYQTAKAAIIAERDAAVRSVEANAAFIAKKAEEFEQIISLGHTELLTAYEQKTGILLASGLKLAATKLELAENKRSVVEQQLVAATTEKDSLEEGAVELSAKLDALKQSAVAHEAKVGELEKEIEAVRNAKAQADARIGEYEARESASVAELATAILLAEAQQKELSELRESSTKQLSEKNTEHQDVIASLRSKIASLESQGEGKDGEVAALEQRIKDLDAAHETKLAEIESRNAAAVAKLQASVAEQAARVEELELANASLTADKATAQERIARLEEQAVLRRRINTRRTATISDLQQSLEQKDTLLEELTAQRDAVALGRNQSALEYQRRINELEGQNQTLAGKITVYEAKEREIKVDLDAAKALVATRQEELTKLQKKFTDQLETIETNHARVIKALESKISNLGSEVEEKSDEVTRIEQSIDELQSSHRVTLEQMQSAHATAVAELESTVHTQTDRIGELEHAIESTRAEKTAAEERLSILEPQVNELRLSLQHSESQIAELTAQSAAIERALDQGHLAIVQIEEDLTRERASRQFGDQIIGWHIIMIEKKDQIAQLLGKIARLRAELGSKETRETEQEAALSAASDENTRLAALVATSQAENERLARDLAALKAEPSVDCDTVLRADSPDPEPTSPSPAIATPSPAVASRVMVSSVMGFLRRAVTRSSSPKARDVSPSLLADLEVEVDLDTLAPDDHTDPISSAAAIDTPRLSSAAADRPVIAHTAASPSPVAGLQVDADLETPRAALSPDRAGRPIPASLSPAVVHTNTGPDLPLFASPLVRPDDQTAPTSPAAVTYATPLSSPVNTPTDTIDAMGTPQGRRVRFEDEVPPPGVPPVAHSIATPGAPTRRQDDVELDPASVPKADPAIRTERMPLQAVIPAAINEVFTSAHVRKDPYFARVTPESKILKVTAPKIKIYDDTSDIEKQHRKTALALEVFLMTYLAGSGKGHLPVLRVKGADSELVALYCAFVEMFNDAGLESTFTKPDFASDESIVAAKEMIQECFDISAAAGVASAGLDKSVVDNIISLYLIGRESSQAQYKKYVSDKMGWVDVKPDWDEKNSLFRGRHAEAISKDELHSVFTPTMSTITTKIGSVAEAVDVDSAKVIEETIMQANGIDPTTSRSRTSSPRH